MYREKYFPRAVLGKNAGVLNGEKLEETREKYINFDLSGLDKNAPLIWRSGGETHRVYKWKGQDTQPIASFDIYIAEWRRVLGSWKTLNTSVVLSGNSASTSNFSWSP